MSTPEFKGQLVDNGELSLRRPPSEAALRWIRFFKSIPEGKSFVSTQKEMGANINTVRSALRRFKTTGEVSKSLRLSYRLRKDGDYDIYVIHDIETKKPKGGVG